MEAVGVLRVMCYNVKRFVVDGACTLEPFVEELRRVKPQILCLNEVDVGKWPTIENAIAGALGHFVFYGHARDGLYGNAIASVFPLTNKICRPLEGGSVIEFPPKSGKLHRIQRGLLVAEVDGSSVGMGRILVATTHLDHIDEKQRTLQLEHVIRELGTLDESVPLLLCGDMNALTRSDYTQSEWSQLEHRHEKNGWSPPTFGALDLLHELRFLDTFAHAKGGPLHIVDEAQKFTASVENPMYRIDYCFANPHFQTTFHVSDAWIHRESRHSDHFPVVVEFMKRAANASVL